MHNEFISWGNSLLFSGFPLNPSNIKIVEKEGFELAVRYCVSMQQCSNNVTSFQSHLVLCCGCDILPYIHRKFNK